MLYDVVCLLIQMTRIEILQTLESNMGQYCYRPMETVLFPQ